MLNCLQLTTMNATLLANPLTGKGNSSI